MKHPSNKTSCIVPDRKDVKKYMASQCTVVLIVWTAMNNVYTIALGYYRTELLGTLMEKIRYQNNMRLRHHMYVYTSIKGKVTNSNNSFRGYAAAPLTSDDLVKF